MCISVVITEEEEKKKRRGNKDRFVLSVKIFNMSICVLDIRKKAIEKEMSFIPSFRQRRLFYSFFSSNSIISVLEEENDRVRG